MTQINKKRIHQIYGILVSVACVFAGICFIAACLNIYRSGVATDAPQIYTRHVVAESFAKIALPVYTCLALVLGGLVLELVLPAEKAKVKPEKNLSLILSRLQDKTDLDSCGQTIRTAVAREHTIRKNLVLCCGILLAGGFAMFLIHACNGSNWGTNSTPSMVQAMYKMFSTMAIPCLFTILSVYQLRKSVSREIDILRQASAQFPKKVEKAAPKALSGKPVAIARIAILAIGILLVVLGACNDGTADILTKAVNICTECVGLG